MAKNAAAGDELNRRPLSFMRTNLVVPLLTAPSGLRSFMLDDRLGECRLADGTPCQGYYLLPGDGAAGCFDAYWCHYAENAIYGVTVGPHAKLMFTADMTGCSLGVGSRTNTGHQFVTHSNCMAIGNLISDLYGQDNGPTMQLLVQRATQQFAQRVSIQQAHGGDVGLQTIEPPSYRRDPIEPTQTLDSTTFGIRDTNRNEWAYYVQKRGDTGAHTELVAVAFVAGIAPAPVNQGGCVLF
jgi:hypothetical protein